MEWGLLGTTTTYHPSVDWRRAGRSCPGGSRSRSSGAWAGTGSRGHCADSGSRSPGRPAVRNADRCSECRRTWNWNAANARKIINTMEMVYIVHSTRYAGCEWIVLGGGGQHNFSSLRVLSALFTISLLNSNVADNGQENIKKWAQNVSCLKPKASKRKLFLSQQKIWLKLLPWLHLHRKPEPKPKLKPKTKVDAA